MPVDISKKRQKILINNFLTFIRTLLPKRHRNIPLDCQLEDGKIKLIVAKGHQQVIIDAITKDPRPHLPYQYQPQQTTSIAATAGQETITFDYELASLNSVEDARKIMLNLFGPQAFKALKLDVNEVFKNARLENGILYLQADEDKDVTEVFEAEQRYFCSYFLNVPRSQIQNAWLGKEILTKQKLPKSTSVIPQGPLASCFGISQQKGVETFINLKRLQELIFPPKVFQKPFSDDKVELTFDENHFQAFMLQYSIGGMLFKFISGSVPNQDFHAKPIIISTPKIAATKPVHRILVDLSLSMQNVFPDVKDFLIKAVQRSLAEGSPEVIVTGFSGERTTPISFKPGVSLTDIKTKINSLELSKTGTGLYNAIEQELRLATSAQLAGDEDFVLTLISDGRDNLKVPEYPNTFFPMSDHDRQIGINWHLGELKSLFAKFNPTNPPRIPIVGLGDPTHVDHEFLKKLALISGSPYEQIKDPKDLDQQLDAMKDLFAHEAHLPLAIDIAGKGRKSYTIRVPADGRLHLSDISFPFSKDDQPLVTFNGVELLISPKLAEISEPDCLDHLANIRTTARKVVMDITIADQSLMDGAAKKAAEATLAQILNEKMKDLAKLQQTLDELSKTESAKPHDEDVSEVRTDLEEIAEALTQAKTNPAAFSAFQTHIRRLQGGVEKQQGATIVACDTTAGWPTGAVCEADRMTRIHTNSAQKTDSLLSYLKWGSAYVAANVFKYGFLGNSKADSSNVSQTRSSPKRTQSHPLPINKLTQKSIPVPLSVDEKLIVADALIRMTGLDVGAGMTYVADMILPSHWDKPVTAEQRQTLSDYLKMIPILKKQLEENGDNVFLQMHGFDGIESAKRKLAQLSAIIMDTESSGKISQTHFDAINALRQQVENVITKSNQIIKTIREGQEALKTVRLEALKEARRASERDYQILKKAFKKGEGPSIDFRTDKEGHVSYTILSATVAASKRAKDISRKESYHYHARGGAVIWKQSDPTIHAEQPDLPLIVSARAGKQ